MRSNAVRFQSRWCPAKFPNIDGHIWVPIDDENTNVYSWKFAASDEPWMTPEEFTASEHRTGRGPEDRIPGTYWMKRDASNDYHIDREVQKTRACYGYFRRTRPGLWLFKRAWDHRAAPNGRHSGRVNQSAEHRTRSLLIEAASNEVEADRSPRGFRS